jgi:hypothetical protein
LFADLTVFLKRSAARCALQKPLCYRPFADLADLADLFGRLVIENRGVVGGGLDQPVFLERKFCRKRSTRSARCARPAWHKHFMRGDLKNRG